MSNECILITTGFPYSYSEPFLEDEIEYISASYDKVIIYSIYGRKSEAQTRKVPNNVVVYPLGIYKKGIFRYLLRGFLKIKIDNELKRRTALEKLFARYYIGKSMAIANKIKKNLPIFSNNDELLIYSYWLNYPAFSAIQLKKHVNKKYPNIKCKIVSRAHGHDVYKERNRLNYLPFQEHNILNVDSVYVCSKKGQEYLKKSYGEYDNIRNAYLGVKAASSSADINSNTFLTVAWFYPVKRLVLFAKAFALFSKTHPNWKWISIGGLGSDFEQVKKIVEEYNIEDKVVFFGALTRDQVIQFYEKNSVSYLVNTSSSEGIPVSMMEAQARGIPCIGTDVGGVREIIEDKNGMLLKPNINEGELSEIMNCLANMDQNKYNEFSQNSYDSWNLKFNASINYDVWVKELKGG